MKLSKLAYRQASALATLCWMGTQLPSSKREQSPQFSAHICCGQMAGWNKMPLGMEVGLGPGNFVFNGDPATPRTEGTPTTTQFLAHVYCGQTAGWMKTPFDTEVDFGPGHIVLDGVPALRETGTAAPHILGLCLLWTRSPISATAEPLFLFFVQCGRLSWLPVSRLAHY